MSRPRPLSPHLSIWRFQLPAVMSITHRMTGVILASGTILLTCWLLALAFGEKSFNLVSIIIFHPLGQLVMFGYSVVLFYHASNGVRHLFWDFAIDPRPTGLGLDASLCSRETFALLNDKLSTNETVRMAVGVCAAC